MDILTDRLKHLEDTFPKNTLHAVAIKTNPLVSILQYITAKGFALEATSFGGMTAKIEYIDIGGGFPANYGDEPQVGMEAYVAGIKRTCSDLFEKYQVITEFGRFVHAHTAWLYSQINSLISNNYGNIALIYQGANLFVREVYTQKSPHQIFSLDKNFQLKKSIDTKPYQIGGPLCFAGDLAVSFKSMGRP